MNKEEVTINDPELADSVRTKGYGILQQLLDPERLARLETFFFQQQGNSGIKASFFTTHWSASEAYRRAVDSYVKAELSDVINANFTGHKCILGYYLFKGPGEDGAVSLHRDWTLTDESKESGLILWIPLNDINKANGGFHVVENSHSENVPIRGTNIHPQIPDHLKTTDLTVDAGDAVVMDNRLMHGSGPNTDGPPRLVVGIILMPKDATILHYYRKSTDRSHRVIRVGDDFLLRSFFDHENPESVSHLEKITDTTVNNSLFGKGNAKKVTFVDPELQSRFEKYGYVTVKNFIDPDTIEQLWNVYEQNKDVVVNRSFFISQWSDKKDHKERINKAVQAALVPRACEYLNDYIPVFAVFGVKHPDPDSGMYLHQDWSHVDETYFRTVNVWCPLLDLSKEHGPVQLLKGSHRLFDTWRGVDIPDSFLDISKEDLMTHFTDIILNAGDVVMWDHRIIHGSGVNTTDVTRVAAIANMRPRDSKFYLFYADSHENPKEIEVFEPPQNFFTANDSANDPSLVKERAIFCHHFPHQRLQVSKAALEEFLRSEFPDEPEQEK